MTVRDLIEKLQNLPQDIPVVRYDDIADVNFEVTYVDVKCVRHGPMGRPQTSVVII